MRLQLVYSLLQEEELRNLHIIASLLLFGGREDESTFEVMIKEGCFSRLLEILKDDRRRRHNIDREEEEGDGETTYMPELHKVMLELLYEMSRAQPLSTSDLEEVDDEFVMDLLGSIEELSNDVDDPYHYPLIRVLVRALCQ